MDKYQRGLGFAISMATLVAAVLKFVLEILKK
ncbi:hypothetical protein CEB3_c25510 [Peptococcaceae bacterium CEB3]|nr:hypothetical protein CEB3_c25510 [Peptococcaceae bacterium CEB3]